MLLLKRFHLAKLLRPFQQPHRGPGTSQRVSLGKSAEAATDVDLCAIQLTDAPVAHAALIGSTCR